MKFFTDITTNCSRYCLCNIKKIEDKRLKDKKEVFIDPSVYELRDRNEYSNIEQLHYLAQSKLPEKYAISIDYPSDMNFDSENQFIEKTNANNFRYADNAQYICTIQSKFQNIEDWKNQFELLKPIFYNKQKILAIGNLCRIRYFTKSNHSYDFMNEIVNTIEEHASGIKQLHIYGLSFNGLRKFGKRLDNCVQFSIDSTKWTRAITKELKLKFGASAKKNARDIFFLEYIKQIQEQIDIDVEY